MLRYSVAGLLLLCLSFNSVAAQELFVYSEPASNMPTGSIGLRATDWIMKENNTSRVNYHLLPEVMWGVNRRLMLHVDGYVSDRAGTLGMEGGGLYAKYRFYSTDKVYSHFRAAIFGRAAINNADIHQQEIAVNGHNTGYQAGLIGTRLLHKTALSVTGYYERAMDNAGGHGFPSYQQGNAVDYVLSAGRLILPRAYKGYKQVNLNLMMELIGQEHLGDGKRFVDLAGAAQMIFNSQTRVDVGYKRQLYGDMLRTAPNGFLIRVEHLLFNVI